MGQGFIPGVGQMAPASRVALSRGPRSSGRRRRRKPKQARRASPRARRAGRMKFGSPAWQKKYKVGRFAKKRR